MFHTYLTVFIMIFVALTTSFDAAWGFLEPYFASYLKTYNDSLTTSQIHLLYSITQSSQILGSLLFRPISIYFGYREGLWLSLTCMGLAYIFISFSTTLNSMIIPGILIGYSTGSRMAHGAFQLISLFPENPGTATGIANVGSPMSIFYLGTLSNFVLNPNNYEATISVQEGVRVNKYFDHRVTDKFTEFWYYLGIFTVIFGFIIVPIMKSPEKMYSQIDYISTTCFNKNSLTKKEDLNIPDNQVILNESNDKLKITSFEKNKDILNELEKLSAQSQGSLKQKDINNPDNFLELKELKKSKENDNKDVKSNNEKDEFRKLLFSSKFIGLIISMAVFLATVMVNHINYKVIGLTMYDDRTLSSFGIISTICTCVGRFFAGVIIDKLGFTRSFRIYLLVFMINLIQYYYFKHILVVFFFCFGIFNLSTGYVITTFSVSAVVIYGVETGAKQQMFIGFIPLINACVIPAYELIMGYFGFTTYIITQVALCGAYLVFVDKFNWG